MDYEIPDCEDIEWQQDMLRILADKLEQIADSDSRTVNEPLDAAIQLVEALRQYSVY